MEKLPVYIYLVFGATLFLALLFFYKATGNSKKVLLLISIWIGLQTVISLAGFYTITDSIPPRVTLLILPPVMLIVGLFISKKGKRFIDSLDIKTLTLFHIIRVPVELVLFWLFINKAVPGLMTFEGRNFDILSGLSAPFIYYFGFVKKKLSNSVLLAWNLICLLLLFNIVINAILSVPTSFQQFAFEQPNIAILYFPFVLLPACLVPLVLFSHLAAIRQLLTKKSD